MSLERLRRQHNLDTKPSMALVGVKTDRNGKRYTFRLNDDAIFYAIGADAFWAGANQAPAETIPNAPEPQPAPARPAVRLNRRSAVPAEYALIRADELGQGDVVARKGSPAGLMTIHKAEPANVHGKTRLTYTNSRGRRTSDAFSGEKFIIHERN